MERDFDNDLNVGVSYDGDGLRTRVTARGVVRAIPTLLATRRFFRRQERFDRQFLVVAMRNLSHRTSRWETLLKNGL